MSPTVNALRAEADAALDKAQAAVDSGAPIADALKAYVEASDKWVVAALAEIAARKAKR